MAIKHKATKVILTVLGILVILFIAVSVYLDRNLNKISKEVLEELVVKQSEGKYKLNYKELDISFFRSAITVEDIVFQPDSAVIFSDSSIKTVYQAEVKEVVINLTSIFPLIFKNELRIKGVEVHEPAVRLYKTANNTEQEDEPEEETKTLYQLISKHLQALSISSFRVYNGGFTLENNNFSLNKIDFTLENVLIDEHTSNRKVFQNEEIEITIRDQSFLLPDSLHIAEYEIFHLSTKDSVLEFKNISVQPKDDQHVKKDGHNHEDIFHVCIPDIRLSGIDYLKAYYNKKLSIREISISNPKVLIEDQKENNDPKKDKKILDFLFTKVATVVDIKHFELTNGSFDVMLFGSQEEHRFEVAHTDVELFEVHLDSSNYRIDKKDKYFENAVLTIRDEMYNLKDSIHQVTFDKLKINTFDSTLQINNLAIKPHVPVNNTMHYLKIEIPKTSLNKVDYLAAINSKVLKTGALNITRPSIFIQPADSSTKTGGKANMKPEEIMGHIDRYFNAVNADNIIINSGNLNIGNEFGIKKINLHTTGLETIKASSSWTELASKLNIELGDLWLNDKNTKLNVNYVELKDPKKIRVNGLVYNNKNGKGKIAEAVVYNINPDSLLIKKKILLDSIDVNQPDLNFFVSTKNKKGETQFPDFLSILNFNDGRINITLDNKVNIKASSIYGRISNQERIKLQQVSLKNIQYRNSDTHLKLFSQSLRLENKTTDLVLRKTRLVSTDSTNVSVTIPDIKITNWHQAEYWESGDIIVDEVSVNTPNITFVRPSQEKKKDKEKINLPNIFVGHFNIKNADLDIGNGNYSVQTPRWNFDIANVKINNGDLEDFIRTEPKFTFSAKDVSCFVGDNIITTKNLDLNGSQKSLTVKEGKFRNTKNNSSGSVDLLQMKDVNYVKLYFDKQFIVNEIKLDQPKAHLIVSEDKGKGNKDFPFVRVNVIDAKKAKFKFEKGNLKHHIENLNFKIDKLHLDKNSHSENYLHYVDNLSLSGGPYKHVTSDGLNTFEVKDYYINYAQQKMVLNEVSLTPKYGKVEYSKYLDNQRDWINLYVKNITLSRMDFDNFIETDRLRIGQVEAYNIDLDVYRDKNVPITNAKFKALPQRLLRDLNDDIFIDSVLFSANIVYQELPEEATVPGHTSFDDLKGSIKNIQAGKMSPTPMVLDATGRLMDVADFKAHVVFNMEDPNDRFHFTGQVKEVDLRELNGMLIPIVYLKVKEGYNMETTFDFIGNNIYSEGEMYFSYRDLKIQVLNSETLDDKGFGQGIMTFFANTFVIKKHNKGFPYVRKGVIFYERTQEKSIFNFWSWSLMSGIINSIGINKIERERDRFLEE